MIKNANNTRILERKNVYCIARAVYFIHGPPVFSILGRPPLGDRLPGSFQADAQLAVNAVLLLAASLGKSINTWNPNAGLAHGSSEPAAAASCAKAVRTAIMLGNDERFTFQVCIICTY